MKMDRVDSRLKVYALLGPHPLVNSRVWAGVTMILTAAKENFQID